MSSSVGDKPATFSIDDREVEIRAGETIFHAARRLGIKLPHLWYSPKPGYRPDGNCRVCMVEIEGERVLAASCIRMEAGFPFPARTKPTTSTDLEMPSGHRDAVRSSCRSAAGAVARPLAARLQQRNGWPGPQGYPHRLQLRV